MRNISLLLLLFLASCTFDYYEKGEGELSRLRADFGMADSNAALLLTSFTTDEGETLRFTAPVKADWVEVADSAYRVQVYYNVGAGDVEPLAVNRVVTLLPRQLKEDEEMKTDPLTLSSAWMSTSRKFINLALTLKAGSADGVKIEAQRVGMVLNGVEEQDGQRIHQLELLHDQCGVPEYFSQTVYVSVPVEGFFCSGDKVTILVETYQGTVERSFEI